jgi:hypothetical protein
MKGESEGGEVEGLVGSDYAKSGRHGKEFRLYFKLNGF